MNHDQCVQVDQFTTDAHTHEGQKGFWLFPSEVADHPGRVLALDPDPAISAPTVSVLDAMVAVLDSAAKAQLGKGGLDRDTLIKVDQLAWTLNQAGLVTQDTLNALNKAAYQGHEPGTPPPARLAVDDGSAESLLRLAAAQMAGDLVPGDTPLQQVALARLLATVANELAEGRGTSSRVTLEAVNFAQAYMRARM